MKYEVKIDIEPKAQTRPRFSTFGKFKKAYEPKQMTEWKNLLALFVSLNMKLKKIELFRNSALKVEIVCGIQPPRTWSKIKKLKAILGKIKRVERPDLDNYIKSVLDALNGILWEDDSFIVSLNAEKKYTEESYIFVSVEEINKETSKEMG